jgi:hypothetical protein
MRVSLVEWTMRTEEQYLLGVLRAFVRSGRNPEAPVGLDWERLESLAIRCQLLPILAHQVGCSRLPPPLSARCQNLLLGSSLQHARALAATRLMAEVLDGDGIPYACLQGIALAGSAYPSVRARPVTRVHLMIPPSASRRIPLLLEAKGLPRPIRRTGRLGCEVDGVPFDLHWAFPACRSRSAQGKWAEWLETRQAFGAGIPLYRLSTNHQLLDLVGHACLWHRWDAVMPLVDIARVCVQERIDWAYVDQWCRGVGLERLFLYTLGLVDSLFQLDLRARCSALDRSPAMRQPGLAVAHYPILFGADSPMRFAHRQWLLLRLTPCPRLLLWRAARMVEWPF